MPSYQYTAKKKINQNTNLVQYNGLIIFEV